MNFETFAMEHPWATKIVKSKLLIRFLEYLSDERSLEEIERAFPELEPGDIQKALRVLSKIGVVSANSEKFSLTELGKEFIRAYKDTFGA